MLFIVIFPPIMNEWLLDKVPNKGIVLAFVVVAPFLGAIALFEIAYILDSGYDIEKAIKHLDKQLNSGVIDLEHYKAQLQHMADIDSAKKEFERNLATQKLLTKMKHKKQQLELLNNEDKQENTQADTD